MLQPVTLAGALLCLLAGMAAEAQPRAVRSRRLTVAASLTEPLPELRVAAGSLTTLVLDARLDKDSVQLDAAHFQLVDAGERSVLFRTLITPSGQQRWVLRVRYADGGLPEWAAFALVAHPTEVDVQVEAVRPQQPLAACQEQLAAAQTRCQGDRPAVWALADGLGGQGAVAKAFTAGETEGWAYRLGHGLLLVFTPGAESGPPWVPTSATLRGNGAVREEVRVRAVHYRPGGPGQWGTVAVEAELPSPSAGESFNLELHNESGQRLKISPVKIPPAELQKKQEGAQ